MTKTPREILEDLIKKKDNIDEALIALEEYEAENKQSEQWILSQVEIDKDWIKDLLLRSGLVTEVGAERIAEGIKLYNPIKLVEEKK